MFLNVGYLNKVIWCCTELTAEFSLSCVPLSVDSTDGYIVASPEDLTCVVIKYADQDRGWVVTSNPYNTKNRQVPPSCSKPYLQIFPHTETPGADLLGGGGGGGLGGVKPPPPPKISLTPLIKCSTQPKFHFTPPILCESL
jgi:hypothetical protein